MDILITTPVAEDARGIKTVFYETWLDTYPNEDLGITRHDIDEKYKKHFTDDYIKEYQKRLMSLPPNKGQWVAKDGDKVVGVCRIEKMQDKNKLNVLYVLPAYQGKKIGYRLWQEALAFAGNDKDIILDVATYNAKAISFYSRLGFVDTGKRFTHDESMFKSGVKIPEMEMVLNLTS